MRTRKISAASRLHLGYVRVSGYDQKVTGVSLEAQTERIVAHAKMRGVALDDIVHDDGRSGSSVKSRPGMKAILARVARGELASVTVFKLDRGFRSAADAANAAELMAKHHCEFVSVTENIDTTSAVGRMQLNMLAAFAQFERDIGAERTAEALCHLKSQGKVYSKVVPYGQRAENGHLVPDPIQQATLTRILAMTSAGTGPTAIARTLNAEQIPPPGANGTKWFASSVVSVLKTVARA